MTSCELESSKFDDEEILSLRIFRRVKECIPPPRYHQSQVKLSAVDKIYTASTVRREARKKKLISIFDMIYIYKNGMLRFPPQQQQQQRHF